ncbi:MAG: O-antigen ligase family protein [Bacteroidales bacterium]
MPETTDISEKKFKVSNLSYRYLMDPKKLSGIFLGSFVVFSVLDSNGLPLLRIILLVGFIFFAYKHTIKNNMSVTYWILVSLILFLSTIALIRGYIVYGKLAFFESKLILGYFAVFSFMILFINSTQVKIIETSILIGSILLSIYFFYMFLCLMNHNPICLGDFLKQNYTLSSYEGRIKLYANNISIFTFLFPFVLVKSILKDGSQRLNLFALFLTGLSTFISLRRGVILSGICGLIITIAIISFKERKMIKRILLVVLLLFVLLTTYFSISTAKFDQYKKEILSSFDFNKNHSNLVRHEQFNFFMEKIKNKPLFGYGLGAHDENYVRNKNNPADFELGYFKMIYAGGLTVFVANFILFLWVFNKARILINRSKYLAKKIAPTLAGWLSLVIYHASNPIFSQFSYLLFYFYLFYLINVFNNMQIEDYQIQS